MKKSLSNNQKIGDFFMFSCYEFSYFLSYVNTSEEAALAKAVMMLAEYSIKDDVRNCPATVTVGQLLENS